MAGKKIVKRVARKAAKKSNRKPKRSFSRYVAKALKNASGKNRLTLSSGAMRICNSFVADMIDRLGNGAASLARANKKRTMGSRWPRPPRPSPAPRPKPRPKRPAPPQYTTTHAETKTTRKPDERDTTL